MAAPCVNDTCSISTSIDAITRQLSINVNRRNQAGLYCDGGLGVKVFGDPVNAMPVDTCFQQLGIAANTGDTDGLGALVGLWSIPGRAQFQGFSSSTAVNIPQGGDEGDESSANPIDTGQSVTNPYDCQAMMLVLGRFRVGYSISTDNSVDNLGLTQQTITSDDAGSQQWIPYNGEIRTRFLIDGVSEAVSYLDIGGCAPNALNNSNKRRWQYFVVRKSLAPGATVSLDATAKHEGNNESINIRTINPTSAPTFDDRGFKCDGEVIIFPFNNEAL